MAEKISLEVKPETSLTRELASIEVDLQVSTAKKYPRTIKDFKERALELATLDQETAESCFYALPREGKTIEGPSARLAEIVAGAWGNLRAEARIIGEDDHFVHAEAVAWDIETNTAIKYQTRRRITRKSGQKYSDDMIAVTANAACSIALRNAIFKIVPMAYVREIYNEARRVAIGDEKTLSSRRDRVFKIFQAMGITPDRVLALINKPSLDDIGIDDLELLTGYRTAIKEGDISAEECFPKVPKDIPKTDGHTPIRDFSKRIDEDVQKTSDELMSEAKPEAEGDSKTISEEDRVPVPLNSKQVAQVYTVGEEKAGLDRKGVNNFLKVKFDVPVAGKLTTDKLGTVLLGLKELGIKENQETESESKYPPHSNGTPSIPPEQTKAFDPIEPEAEETTDVRPQGMSEIAINYERSFEKCVNVGDLETLSKGLNRSTKIRQEERRYLNFCRDQAKERIGA